MVKRDDYNGYMREYMLRRYHQRREEAKRVLGGKCAQCGATEDLQVDHINWRQKEIPLNRLWSASKARFFEELKKCQLLCADCHLEKSRTDISEQARLRYATA